MLLQILRTFERLSAEVTFVWLQGHVDADVGSDVITLDGGGTAGVPATGQVQVVCALPSDVLLADVFLESVKPNSPFSTGDCGTKQDQTYEKSLGGRTSLRALVPLTC